MNTQDRAQALLSQLALQERSIARLKKLEPILKAAAEGKTIQWQLRGEWVIDHSLTFSDDPTQYRIKPEVVRTKRFWWKSAVNPGQPALVRIVDEIDEQQEPRESWKGFISWIDTEWQEHEVTT